jgi:predicted DNA-binding transcriptional regulator AlpA
MRTDLKPMPSPPTWDGSSHSQQPALADAATSVNADHLGIGAGEACSPSPSSSPTLLDRRAVCRMFGGSKPINAATLYRGIRAGRFPRPIRIGGSSRWLRDECEAVLQTMIEGRGR